MYIETAILAVLLGLLLGGRLKNLLDIRIKALWALILSVLISLVPRIPVVGAFLCGLGMPAAIAVAVFRYGFFVVFAVLNARNLPIAVIGLGGVCNFLATIANGGRMPVSAAALGIGTHQESVAKLAGGMIFNYQLADSSTHLLFLCDIIRARGINIYFLSVGDILIAVGILALILREMKPKLLHRLYGHIRAAGRKQPL